MSGEGTAYDLGDAEITPAELLPGTFRACGVQPSSSSARIRNSELLHIANSLEPIYRQTAGLFCWATGLTKVSEITDASVEHFCSVMLQVGWRFGSHPRHLDSMVEDAVMAAKANNKRPRDESTITRHCSRLAQLRACSPPRLEARVRSPGWINLAPDEAAHIHDADGHRGFLLVERHGTVVSTTPLKTFGSMMRSASSAKVLASILVQEAAQVSAAQQEQGRAFVGTLHHNRILIIQRFWNALRA